MKYAFLPFETLEDRYTIIQYISGLARRILTIISWPRELTLPTRHKLLLQLFNFGTCLIYLLVLLKL